ncbi:hypothetical protein Moror_2049 [Moniliophthora roreri MCA 2997]|uniref:Uncharacterized protein n=1 Tax=Moniliophthora roreri (strain MCA 2997) TaxID=1381753 RepID=V2X3Z8_MONRO|nr:hypothetical protein Moror_2049 [Moniliophthora roreri MCA 2997]
MTPIGPVECTSPEADPLQADFLYPLSLIACSMRFSALFASLALSLVVSAAPSPATEVTRADSPTVECIVFTKRMGSYKNHYSAACSFLAGACLDRVRDGLTDLWNDRACLAAATCQGTETTVGLAGCANPEIAALGHEGLPHFSQWVQFIVPDCNTIPDRCNMDQQHYIDFFYGTLSQLGSTVWPIDVQSEVIDLYWKSILEWTAIYPDVVKWSNFDD